VFNRDLGTIVAIDLEEQEVLVLFVERQVHYNYTDLSELAWAITTTSHRGVNTRSSLFPCLCNPVCCTVEIYFMQANANGGAGDSGMAN